MVSEEGREEGREGWTIGRESGWPGEAEAEKGRPGVLRSQGKVRASLFHYHVIALEGTDCPRKLEPLGKSSWT